MPFLENNHLSSGKSKIPLCVRPHRTPIPMNIFPQQQAMLRFAAYLHISG